MKTYTEEQRLLNAECSVVMGVQDYFASDPATVRLLEDEIDRRGLQYKYMDWLMAFTSLCSDERDQRWALIRATPEAKARAFLAVMEPSS